MIARWAKKLAGDDAQSMSLACMLRSRAQASGIGRLAACELREAAKVVKTRSRSEDGSRERRLPLPVSLRER
jgi:hypothetical protein